MLNPINSANRVDNAPVKKGLYLILNIFNGLNAST